MEFKYHSIVKSAGYASLIQFVLIISGIIMIAWVGIRPETAEEAFEVFGKHPLMGLLKDELLIIIMLSLYFITFSALWFILKEHRFALTWWSVLMTFAGVILCIASHSGFSLMYLSEQYHHTTDPVLKDQLLMAGNTVIAKNMWHSTSSYFCGIFLQGAGIMISVAMMGHGGFKKITIITGILGNGFDLIQHLIHPMLPDIAGKIIMLAGPFYFIWYIVLGLDLLNIAKNIAHNHDKGHDALEANK